FRCRSAGTARAKAKQQREIVLVTAVRDHRRQRDAPEAPGPRLVAALVMPLTVVLLGPMGHARDLLHPVPDPESAPHPFASLERPVPAPREWLGRSGIPEHAGGRRAGTVGRVARGRG